MAKLIVDKTGSYNCDGNGSCGGSDFINRERIMKCFHCEHCPSYKRDGLKIINNKGQTTL